MRSKFLLTLLCFCSIFADEIELEVPLFFNGKATANVDIFVDLEYSLVRVKERSIVDVCSTILTDDGTAKLIKFISMLGYIPENTPKKNQFFSLYFSTVNQALYIEVDLQLLKPRFFNVMRPNVREGIRGGVEVKPKEFSGYMNLELGGKHRKNFNVDVAPSGWQSFGNFNGNLHYKDTNLTGFGYFLQENTLGINTANLVLSKEFPKQGIKCSLGTISSLGISFQGTSPLIGFNLSKNTNLITDPVIGSMSRHDIFLNAPSEVRILVNGVDVNRLDLPAGSHVLQNFPLADGLNNIQLHITGPAGEVRVVDLSMFYSAHLMKVGEVASNVSVGFPQYDIHKGPDGFYTVDAIPAFTGFVKQGTLPFLTLAAYLQYYKESIFSGFQAIFSKYYFRGIGEVGLSYDIHDVPYFRARAGISQPDAWKFPLSWNFVIEGQEGQFKFFGGETVTTEMMQFLASGSIGGSALGVISVNLTGQYGYYRDVKHKYLLQGTVSATPTSWCTLRGIVAYEDESGNTEKGRVQTAFNIDVSPNYENLTSKTRYNTKQRALSTSIQYNQALTANRSLSADIGYNTAPGANQMEGHLVYKGSLAAFRFSQQLMKNNLNVNSTVAVTDLNFGTSVCFAGSQMAISRPIYDSFFIVAPNRFLRDSPIVVNPGVDDFMAQASYYLPTVIPLSSYSGMNLSLVKKDGTYGGDLEESIYYVSSLKRSGGVLEVGESPKYIIEGNLFLDGEEATDVTGMLISNFKVDGEYLQYRFFSDEDGTFQIIGIIPGEYTIRFRNKFFKRIDHVTIAPNKDTLNYIFLGDFFIEKKEKEKKYKEVINETETS